MSLPRADEWTDPGSMDPPPRTAQRIVRGLAVATVAVIGSLVVWIATSLSRLPDIGPPFDLDALGTVNIPESENAFTYYRAAVAKLSGHRTNSGGHYVSWAMAPQLDKDWFLANRDAAKLWMAGTTMSRSAYHEPKENRIDTNLDVAQRLRSFLPLAELASLRMEGQGDLDEAWRWHLAALRSTRHCGMHGTFIERLIGVAMYGQVARSIRRWSDHPNVSIDTLRQALNDVIATNAMTAPFSQNLQAEYFALAHLLNEPGISVWRIDHAIDATPEAHDPTKLEHLKWSITKAWLREPERSRRVLRLVFANWLAVADLPEEEQLQRKHAYPVNPIYDVPDNAPASARKLTPDDLNRWVESTRLARAIFPAMKMIDGLRERDRTERQALVDYLRDQIKRREQPKIPKPSSSPSQKGGEVGPPKPAK